MTQKLEKLADIIVDYSIKVQKNECVLIQTYGDAPIEFVRILLKKIINKGAAANVREINSEFQSIILENAIEKTYELSKSFTKYIVENFDSFIQIRNYSNTFESKNIPTENHTKLGKITEKYNDIKINKRKWVLLDYPNTLGAYKSGMTNEEFFDYTINAMNYDYNKMSKDILPLKKLMEKTDKVRIVSPDTDLTFSIKGINVVECVGTCNLPDGEIFTAPIKKSVNGKIKYNIESNQRGMNFNDVTLEFKDGKIINATCTESNEKLNEIFDTDEGSRYVGEFAIGFNPLVTKPMNNILYDEKINGSIHFTPGKCYDEASNGNKSSIHWDLVLVQTKEYGGGEIYFDDVLIRKDGKFVLDSLKQLN
ncbi:MAG: aminopeptidase [Bacilli bacterium]